MNIKKDGLVKMKRRGVTIYVEQKDVDFQRKNGFVKVPSVSLDYLSKLKAEEVRRLALHFKIVNKKQIKAKKVPKVEELIAEIKKEADSKGLKEILQDIAFVHKQQEDNKALEEAEDEE